MYLFYRKNIISQTFNDYKDFEKCENKFNENLFLIILVNYFHYY